MQHKLNMSGDYYRLLKNHLFPGDGLEAAAVALCGRYTHGDTIQLLVHELTLIPYNECVRKPDLLNWKTERVIPYFERVAQKDFAILKIHSHPGGYDDFSRTDDKADRELFESVFGWSETDNPHASAIMLPDGKMFGRFFSPDLNCVPIDKITIVGDVITIFENQLSDVKIDDFALRNVQTFGDSTYAMMKRLKVGVVGCSGTGSIVIEQLMRLSIGSLVTVDPDKVESKNLNRILQATRQDATETRAKVDVITESISKIGLGTNVIPFQANLFESIDAIRALIECDVIFGCVDSYDGRFLLNQLSTFYLKPYFDIGVRLDADKKGGIDKICGSVHYIQPGRSSLMTRGVFDMENVMAAALYRKDPVQYESLKKDGYIKNVRVENPAVISVNMLIAAHGVNEFLNRIHPFHISGPESFAQSMIDVTENYIDNINENDLKKDEYLVSKVGRGDTEPFLEIPEIQVK